MSRAICPDLFVLCNFLKKIAMAKSGGFTSGSLREKCCNCSCKGHDPCLQTFVDDFGIRYYLVNREQLNELWACTIGEQLYFCKKESKYCETLICNVCQFVDTFYLALVSKEFFNFDKKKEDEAVLWRVYTRFLDKKINPFLVKIEIAKRM